MDPILGVLQKIDTKSVDPIRVEWNEYSYLLMGFLTVDPDERGEIQSKSIDCPDSRKSFKIKSFDL